MPPFATIQRARIDLGLGRSPSTSVCGPVRIGRRRQHSLFRHPDGIDNLPRPPSDPNQPRARARLPDRRLPDSECAGSVSGRESQARCGLAAIIRRESEVIRLTDRHRCSWKSAPGRWPSRTAGAVLDGLSGTLSLGDDDLTIERLDLRALGSRAELMAPSPIRYAGQPTSKCGPTSTLLMRAASLVPRARRLAGDSRWMASVKGALSAPAIEARVHGSELTFQNLSGGQLDLTGAFDLTTRQARISSFEVEGAWGTATAEGEVSLDASQRSRLRATIERLDVAAVSQADQACRMRSPLESMAPSRETGRPRLPRRIGSCRGETDHHERSRHRLR